MFSVLVKLFVVHLVFSWRKKWERERERRKQPGRSWKKEREIERNEIMGFKGWS
jgi:hypothetical protein